MEFLEEYQAIMKPIAQALDILQGEEQAYFGVLLPTLTIGLKELKHVETNIHVCKPLLVAVQNGIKRKFNALLNNNDNHLASAFHPCFKLGWLPFLAYAGFDNQSIDMLRNQIKRKMEHLVQNNSFSHDSLSDNSSSNSDNLVRDDFFQDFERRKDEETQLPESHAIDKFLKEPTVSHRERPAPIQFKNATIKDLFVKYNTALPSSAAVERLFSIKKDVLKPKRSGLTDEHFEMLVFMKGSCEQFV